MGFLVAIFAILLGIVFGTITGLIPGIHVNLIATFILANIIFLLQITNVQNIVLFIICMSLTHTFVDFIPTTIIGIPSNDTVLGILPSQKLMIEGKGYEAIVLSSLGSLVGAILAIIIMPFFFLYLDIIYSKMKILIPYFLIVILLILIAKEENLDNKFWAFIIVIFGGMLGLLVLNSHLIKNPLFILFTGLFALSTIINVLFEKDEITSSKFAKQSFSVNIKSFINLNFIKTMIISLVSATICSITPGLGNAQAATISSIFFKKITSRLYIVSVSAINTINFTLSIVTFAIISRARNGAILAISQIIDKIKTKDVLVYIFLICILSFFLFLWTLFLGKNILKFVQKINIKYVNISILVLLLFMIFFVTNIYGILIVICATFLGILCINLNISRVHLMSVLIVPIIFNLL